MELDSHIPPAGRYFNYLYQTAIGVHTGAQHTSLLKPAAIAAAELIAVPVTLLYTPSAICFISL